jgi:epoxyqueuosine reductase
MTLPPPNLGRSVRVVGPVTPVDPQHMPHQRNERGELGKALYKYYNNTVSRDPLTRTSAPVHFADPGNYVNFSVQRSKLGQVNPERTPVSDPAAMARHIKRVARYLGADVVAIAPSHPAYLYAGRYMQDGKAEDAFQQDSTEALARRFPYLIFVSVAWDYDTLQAHRHHIGDASYHFAAMKNARILKVLEGYIKELGYTTLRGTANGQAAALAGGVGELGRNGLLISQQFGARIHAQDPIMTDLPLVADQPIDIGVSEFCQTCRKCAASCPTNSITFEDKVVHNGIEKYKINWETCYRLRPFMTDFWDSCLTCVTVCPFTKPNKWWRTLAMTTLRTTPARFRQVVVRPLLWLDNRVWGEVLRKRVRWLGYDSGIKPGEKGCTIAGCTAAHEEGTASSFVPLGELGYYAPLKENTNRFVKRSGG